MKTSNDLFQLIKSLDKNEKRYFKLFSSLHAGDKKYMLLYEAIAKQQQYDEQELLVRFEKERFVKQFWVAKNHLYNLILQSLESYHSNIEAKLYSELHRITILYEKGLYAQCEKVIEKAKGLAIKYEKHTVLLELLQKEIELFKSVSYIDRTEADVEAVFQEMFAVEKKISKLNQYSRLASQLSIFPKKKGQPRNKEEWKTVEDILNHPLLAKTQVGTQNFVSLPVLAQCYYYFCQNNYYELKRDYSAAEQYALKQVKLFEENFHLTASNPILYINALWSLIVSLLDLRRYEEGYLTIVRLNRFSVGCSKNIRQIVFYGTANTELVLYTDTGNFKKGIVRANEMLTEYRTMDIEPKDKLRELLLYYNIAHVYFQAGNYALANSYLNKILNDTTYPNNANYCFARILSLLTHFELDKRDLLEYEVKSVHRFLYKRNRLYKVETIILDFISKELPKINSAVETQYIASLKKSFEVLLIKMKALTNDSFERKAFDYFDFVSWLESKIENRPFAEVVREKAGSPS